MKASCKTLILAFSKRFSLQHTSPTAALARSLMRARRCCLKSKTTHQAPAVSFFLFLTVYIGAYAFFTAAPPSVDIANCAALSKLCDRVKLKNQSSQPILLQACFSFTIHAANRRCQFSHCIVSAAGEQLWRWVWAQLPLCHAAAAQRTGPTFSTTTAAAAAAPVSTITATTNISYT